MSIFATIVLYRPDEQLLHKNILAVAPQVDHIVLVDNGSNERKQIEKIVEACGLSADTYTIIWNNDNLGIAAALNQGLQFSADHGATWLLTLDQDSEIQENTIEEYRKFLDLDYVGQLSCVFFDPDNDEHSISEITADKPFTELACCITSGSLNRISALMEIGGFDERLFIDNVDYDLSFRLQERGYRIYGIPTVRMQHRLGNMVKRKFLFYRYCDYRYTPMRTYYQARNSIYMLRRFPCHKKRFVMNLLHVFGTTFLGGRPEALRAFFRGVKDSKNLEVK